MLNLQVFASDYEPTPSIRKQSRTAVKRKLPEDIADYLARDVGKEQSGSVDVSGKETVRKQQTEEEAHKMATLAADKQSKYSRAVKKAKKETAEVFAKTDDEYDEIEAAINRQKLVMNSGVSKKGEAAVHEILSQAAGNSSSNANPMAAPASVPNPPPISIEISIPTQNPAATPAPAQNPAATPAPGQNPSSNPSLKATPNAGKDDDVLITDEIHFINAVPSLKEAKQYRQR